MLGKLVGSSKQDFFLNNRFFGSLVLACVYLCTLGTGGCGRLISGKHIFFGMPTTILVLYVNDFQCLAPRGRCLPSVH